jgi:hypothetical protein
MSALQLSCTENLPVWPDRKIHSSKSALLPPQGAPSASVARPPTGARPSRRPNLPGLADLAEARHRCLGSFFHNERARRAAPRPLVLRAISPAHAAGAGEG